MPLFSFFFFFFSLANMGLPGLCIFVGEFLTTIGIFATNTFAALVCALASILTVGYMILLYNRVIFGGLKTQYIKNFKDMSGRDF
jgi:NADH-quinone oxidoreductase subunit M